MRCFNIYCYRIAFMINFKSQDVILYDTPPFMENEKEYAYAYKYKDYFWQKSQKLGNDGCLWEKWTNEEQR